jgi:Flavinator of succinate dehydrogenase
MLATSRCVVSPVVPSSAPAFPVWCTSARRFGCAPAATLQPSYDRSVSDAVLRKRLFYQSHKRGMKENDLLLGTFAHEQLEKLNREEVGG